VSGCFGATTRMLHTQATIWIEKSSAVIPGPQETVTGGPLDAILRIYDNLGHLTTFQFVPPTLSYPGGVTISLRNDPSTPQSATFDQTSGALRLFAPVQITASGSNLTADVDVATYYSVTPPTGHTVPGKPVDRSSGTCILVGTFPINDSILGGLTITVAKAWIIINGTLGPPQVVTSEAPTS
jgi:hypothetical protein